MLNKISKTRALFWHQSTKTHWVLARHDFGACLPGLRVVNVMYLPSGDQEV